MLMANFRVDIIVGRVNNLRQQQKVFIAIEPVTSAVIAAAGRYGSHRLPAAG